MSQENACRLTEKVYCVISHTHWDREWYLTFEQLRIQLVDLMNNLLQVIKEYPNYIFHLDAQTIIVEDYLEICPQNRQVLFDYIKSGNIIVGPWYVQNDFYLTDGEATIRNLQIGIKMAEQMGCSMKIGYIPDQFGNISQLPQIFNQFGINGCFLGRGYSFYKKDNQGVFKREHMPAGFSWEGEEGSKVLAIRFSWWYNNAQRFSQDMEKALGLIDIITEQYGGQEQTPYYLCMNGVDHLEAQEDLFPVLTRMNKKLPEGERIEQYTMQKYIDHFSKYIADHNIELSKYVGELRNGHDYDLLKGTLSGRIYLKIMNAKAQNLLEKNLEPIYSFAQMMGLSNTFPKDYMEYLWKSLLKNHPHDSICGCSIDPVHDHMEDRYKCIDEVGKELLRRGMELVSSYVTREGMTPSDYMIVLFNTINSERTSIAEATLEFPTSENVKNFDIIDQQGNKVPYYVTGKYLFDKRITSAINLPSSIETECYKVRMLIPPIAGLSYRRLVVRPSIGEIETEPSKKLPEYVMENNHIKLTVNSDGKVDLISKKEGHCYNDILMFEDIEDIGTSYVYHNMGNQGKPETLEERYNSFCSDGANEIDIENLPGRITTEAILPRIEVICDNAVEQICRLSYALRLPNGFDFDKWQRSTEASDFTIDVVLKLAKESEFVEFEINIDNKVCDHRLRMLINSGIKTDFSHGLIPFDVVTRDRRNVNQGVQNGTQPNSGFVTVTDGSKALTIMNEGVYEYEHLEKGRVALTILRACATLSKQRDQKVGSDMFQIGNQCLRKYTVRVALYPNSKGASQAAAEKLEQFQTPLLAYFQHYNVNKFSGGRPAVQDSLVSEIFFRQDPHASVKLPIANQIARVDGEGVVLSALKMSGEMLVIRVYNITDKETVCAINVNTAVKQALLLNLNETCVGEVDMKNITLLPKQIATIGIKL